MKPKKDVDEKLENLVRTKFEELTGEQRIK